MRHGLGVWAVVVSALLGVSCSRVSLPAGSFETRHEAMAVVSIAVVDACDAKAGITATAFGIWLDGQYQHDVLVFGGAGQTQYGTLLGPLPAGRHAVDLRPSAFWPPVPCVRPGPVSSFVVERTDSRSDMLRYAPVVEVRADTIGEQSDLPLFMYVEQRTTQAERTYGYTLVFSNEDGGTPTRALWARWGRTVDIERIYDVVLGADQVRREEFQGPRHEIRPFAGRRVGVAPVLLVATENNMVSDRGRGLVRLRPVPELIDLSKATRESTLDTRTWAWRVMRQELRREGRIETVPAPAEPTDVAAPDPAWYLFFEARVDVDHTRVAAWATDKTGRRVTSHHERLALTVERDGWIRVAVPLGTNPGASLAEAGWVCLPDESSAPTAPGACTIDAARVFVINEAGEPGPNLVVPASLTLRSGESASLKRP